MKRICCVLMLTAINLPPASGASEKEGNPFWAKWDLGVYRRLTRLIRAGWK